MVERTAVAECEEYWEEVAEVKILVNGQVDKEKWNKFVFDNPRGNIFQTYEFYEIYKKTKNIEPLLIIIEEGKEILCGLLAYISTEMPGVFSFLSRRAVIHGGPIYSKKGKDYLNELMRECNQLLKKQALFVQIRNIFDVSDIKCTLEKEGFVYEPHLNFHISLKQKEEELWKSISKSKRKAINKSQNEVKVSILKGIDGVYPLLKETYKSVGIPLVDYSHFDAVQKILKDKLKVYIAEVPNEKNPVGCRLALCDNGLVYDWYAGARSDLNHLFINDCLVWSLLKDNLNEFAMFDFGGAGHPDKPYGVREFKRRFGGQLVDYGRYQKVLSKIGKRVAEIGYRAKKWLADFR